MEHQEFLIEFKYKVHANYVLWSGLQILLTEWQCLSVEQLKKISEVLAGTDFRTFLVI